MKLEDLTRDVFLFAAMLRDRLEKDASLTPSSLAEEAKRYFAAMDTEAQKHPELEVRYGQIRYGLVALVDELVMTSTWSHAGDWQTLEMVYYHSKIAGERVYELIEAFSAADGDLIELFFYILALGFRGDYALDEGLWASKLEDLYRRLPKRVDRDDPRISPEAYRVIARKSHRLDPLFSLTRTALICLVCLIVLFVFYKVAWHDVVNKARAKADDVRLGLSNKELSKKLEEVEP